MKLILKNSNYVHPVTGEIFNNVFVSEGEFSDIPLLQKLKISLWLCQTYTDVKFNNIEGVLQPVEIEKVRVLDADILEFTSKSEIPTYVTIGSETKDLFAHLDAGGTLEGTEPIEVGYPNYTSIQKYLLKDDIGDELVFNPTLDTLGLKIAKEFILTRWKLNGEPLGVQFKFEEL
ncbi:hypothetical protein [Tenacibaculum singaporense]|uniref:hypothetical protein n=1 Tax=Tenacibaculum singaporense TaxID=2358479 RepID=UPI000F66D18E|nr:hypothetical protein [Tenacibaculum singaporense]RSC96060.1 hypothetical protein EI424_02765 [Tenacibaculum singaporense]